MLSCLLANHFYFSLLFVLRSRLHRLEASLRVTCIVVIIFSISYVMVYPFGAMTGPD